jgi:hypothetical protein
VEYIDYKRWIRKSAGWSSHWLLLSTSLKVGLVYILIYLPGRIEMYCKKSICHSSWDLGPKHDCLLLHYDIHRLGQGRTHNMPICTWKCTTLNGRGRSWCDYIRVEQEWIYSGPLYPMSKLCRCPGSTDQYYVLKHSQTFCGWGDLKLVANKVGRMHVGKIGL